MTAARVTDVGCPRCHGDDWIEDYGAACGTCHGLGTVEVLEVDELAPPAPEPAPRASCRRCGGEGAVDSSEDVGPSGMVTCPRCHGDGFELAPAPRGTATRVTTPGAAR